MIPAVPFLFANSIQPPAVVLPGASTILKVTDLVAVLPTSSTAVTVSVCEPSAR